MFGERTNRQPIKMRCSHTIYNDRNRCGRKCKRNACDGSDFCKQHNPLNKLDDIMCAICLEDIKDPIKAGSCRHIFCKGCLATSVLNTNSLCPCCRTHLGVHTVVTCVEVVCGKESANRFTLRMEMAMNPHKWTKRPWTTTMTRRFVAAFPDQLM